MDLIQHERIRYTIICFISSCTAERRTACLEEVQRLKTADEDDNVSMKSEDMDEDLPCKATLKISGISLGKITEADFALLKTFNRAFYNNFVVRNKDGSR